MSDSLSTRCTLRTVVIQKGSTSAMTDQQLLAHYLDHHPEAFSKLVERHLPLVYHAAVRQVGASNAEDITQVVFALLAQRVTELSDRSCLAGWLHEATRYCCRNYQRAESRRRRHESEAAMHKQLTTSGGGYQDSDLKTILDDALARLNPLEREAVLLRYLENRSIDETAAALAIAPAAAAKRAIRGLNKLRMILSQKGVAIPLATLGVVLAAQSAQAIPAGLLVAASVAPGSTTISNTAATLGHGMRNGGGIFASSFNKVAAAIALVVGLLAIFLAVYNNAPAHTVTAKADPKPEATSPVPILTSQDLGENGPAATGDEGAIPENVAKDARAAEKVLAQMRKFARENDLRSVRGMMLTTDDAENLLADSLSVGMVNTETMLAVAENRFTKEKVQKALLPDILLLSPVTERQWLITGNLIPTEDNQLIARMVWRNDHWMIDLRTQSHGGVLPSDLRLVHARVMAVLAAEEQAHSELTAGKISSAYDLAASIRRASQGRASTQAW